MARKITQAVQVTWSIDYELGTRHPASGEMRWELHHGIPVPDERWVRGEFDRRKAEKLPNHMRNLQLVKITREVVEQ